MREAITSANSAPGADTIQFDNDYTITLITSLPAIPSDITIVGNGWDKTIVDGGNPAGGTSGVRPFEITSAGVLELDGVSVRNGYDVSQGGGVRNYGGTLVFRNSRCESNRSRYGGGIWVQGGSLTVDHSVIVGNEVFNYGSGGGIRFADYSGGNQMTVTDSEIRDNRSDFKEGGIDLSGTATTTVLVEGTLIDNNQSPGWTAFGGYAPDTVVEVTNCTISNNDGCGIGGFSGLFTNLTLTGNTTGICANGASGSTITVRNSIIANSTNSNCYGLTSGGHNIEDADTCGFAEATDQVNTDPKLDVLQDNGGPTRTVGLLAGSPAVDSGDDALAPATDQRGYPRPVDGDGNGVAVSDIGAFEAPFGLPEIFSDGFESGDYLVWTTTTP